MNEEQVRKEIVLQARTETNEMNTSVLMQKRREQESILYELDNGMQGCIQVYVVRARISSLPRSRKSNPLSYASIRPELILKP